MIIRASPLAADHSHKSGLMLHFSALSPAFYGTISLRMHKIPCMPNGSDLMAPNEAVLAALGCLDFPRPLRDVEHALAHDTVSIAPQTIQHADCTDRDQDDREDGQECDLQATQIT